MPLRRAPRPNAQGELGMTDNVVFLAFSSDKTEPDTLCLSACTFCRNKTFSILHDREQGFPMLRCAACGSHIGRIGWAHEDDAPGIKEGA